MRQTKAALTQAGEELARQLSSQAHRRERHGPDPTGEAATDSDDDRSAPGKQLTCMLKLSRRICGGIAQAAYSGML